jgi:hypothetical protein
MAQRVCHIFIRLFSKKCGGIVRGCISLYTLGASRRRGQLEQEPSGRWGGRSATHFVSSTAHPFPAKLDAGRAFPTTPWRMDSTMLEGGLIDEAIEVARQLAGDLRRSPGTGPVHAALGPLLGKTLHPCAEGRIGTAQPRTDRIDVVACNDRADGWRATKAPGLLRLLAHGRSRCQRIIAHMACEGTHRFAPWRHMTYSNTLLSGAK